MRDLFDTGPVLRLGDAKAMAPEPDPLQVDVLKLTMVEIASLVGNARHESRPEHRKPLDLFTAAFSKPINHGDTSPESLRANHAALVAKEGQNGIAITPNGRRYTIRDGRIEDETK